ncbi:hypothetical protein ASE14_09635 [Agromyces sp. Root81]|nr:hypothetical protein ASE14_09635 [Agromyces sp. Root81]
MLCEDFRELVEPFEKVNFIPSSRKRLIFRLRKIAIGYGGLWSLVGIPGHPILEREDALRCAALGVFIRSKRGYVECLGTVELFDPVGQEHWS